MARAMDARQQQRVHRGQAVGVRAEAGDGNGARGQFLVAEERCEQWGVVDSPVHVEAVRCSHAVAALPGRLVRHQLALHALAARVPQPAQNRGDQLSACHRNQQIGVGARPEHRAWIQAVRERGAFQQQRPNPRLVQRGEHPGEFGAMRELVRPLPQRLAPAGFGDFGGALALRRVSQARVQQRHQPMEAGGAEEPLGCGGRRPRALRDALAAQHREQLHLWGGERFRPVHAVFGQTPLYGLEILF